MCVCACENRFIGSLKEEKTNRSKDWNVEIRRQVFSRVTDAGKLSYLIAQN